ncbi:MAG: hypothetical protein MZV63_03045 [Marinilabiliales bacterium]|nr:hypothetical protein [Marinilabiliales bacterium]
MRDWRLQQRCSLSLSERQLFRITGDGMRPARNPWRANMKWRARLPATG